MIIGADLALKHGALVDIDGNVIFTYTDRPGLDTTLEDVFQTARIAATATPSRSIIIIDFDRTQGSWSAGSTGTLITLLTGYYTALVRTKRCLVSYCSPNQVRLCLGCQPFCSKEDVHFAARDYIPAGLDDPEGDKIDAWLLALTYQCSKGVEP